MCVVMGSGGYEGVVCEAGRCVLKGVVCEKGQRGHREVHMKEQSIFHC